MMQCIRPCLLHAQLVWAADTVLCFQKPFAKMDSAEIVDVESVADDDEEEDLGADDSEDTSTGSTARALQRQETQYFDAGTLFCLSAACRRPDQQPARQHWQHSACTAAPGHAVFWCRHAFLSLCSLQEA